LDIRSTEDAVRLLDIVDVIAEWAVAYRQSICSQVRILYVGVLPEPKVLKNNLMSWNRRVPIAANQGESSFRRTTIPKREAFAPGARRDGLSAVKRHKKGKVRDPEHSEQWNCPRCKDQNEPHILECVSCTQRRPILMS
jgi:hypothetical protein